MELINYLSSDGDLAGSVDEMKQTTRAETPVSVVRVIVCYYLQLYICSYILVSYCCVTSSIARYSSQFCK